MVVDCAKPRDENETDALAITSVGIMAMCASSEAGTTDNMSGERQRRGEFSAASRLKRNQNRKHTEAVFRGGHDSNSIDPNVPTHFHCAKRFGEEMSLIQVRGGKRKTRQHPTSHVSQQFEHVIW